MILVNALLTILKTVGKHQSNGNNSSLHL
ncbi:hypothetical protein DSUL_260013 [Desulfovibrionales bacterium]